MSPVSVRTSTLALAVGLFLRLPPAQAQEPREGAGSPVSVEATDPPAEHDAPVASSPPPHQCFQQSRFLPRRAKKKPAPSSPSSQATPQDRNG